MEIDREYLIKHGSRIVSRINHEEYQLGDKVYVCGWRSPYTDWQNGRQKILGKWMIYEKKQEGKSMTNFEPTTARRQQKTQRITLEIDVVGDEIDSEQCEKIADSFTNFVCQVWCLFRSASRVR